MFYHIPVFSRKSKVRDMSDYVNEKVNFRIRDNIFKGIGDLIKEDIKGEFPKYDKYEKARLERNSVIKWSALSFFGIIGFFVVILAACQYKIIGTILLICLALLAIGGLSFFIGSVVTYEGGKYD